MAKPRVTVPDVGGRQARIEALVKHLTAAARRRADIEIAKAANGHGDDDPVPGYPNTDQDGNVNSYVRVLAQLDEQEQRLADTYPEEMSEVAVAFAQREEQG